MTPLAVAFIATAAVCVMVAFERLGVALRVPGRRHEIFFATAAAAVAGDAVCSLLINRADSASQVLRYLAWDGFFLLTAVTCLAWFVDLWTGAARRSLVVGETAVAILGIVAGFTIGITFAEITEFRVVELPWGEAIRKAIGTPSPWRWLGDLANVGFLLILIDTTWRLKRRGDRRESRIVGVGLAVFSLALLLIIPADLGLISLPGPHTFAFLVIVGAMSWVLSTDLIRASGLAREVVANERRWRQLLDSVQLLVVEIDNSGRIRFMNPFAEQVSGRSADEMVGKDYLEFVSPEERGEIEESVNEGLGGDPQSDNERRLMTTTGDVRTIRWRSVVLRNPDGDVEGLLSVGADVTKRRESEAELERTVAELEVLRHRLEAENVYLREEIRDEHGFDNIVGGSDPLLYVLHKVRQVAPADTSVLILGESGVGKELIARTIHDESPRSQGPFVVVNCAALPANLIESELFGHERGAFTGAERQRRGRFELADGGTIFLDEIGELPLEMQPKLLRVLQEGEIERVGGSHTIPVDVRVVAATNKDLNAEMEDGRFREDLFYRIAVYPITVPALRDRIEDIPPLIEHFVRHSAVRRGKRIDEIPAELMRRLQAYPWPGNVRELQNIIERAVLTSSGGVLRLAAPLQSVPNYSSTGPRFDPEDGLLTLDEVDRRHIERVLEATGGKISGAGGAAEILGLHANTLRYRIKKLGISINRAKDPTTARP